MHRASHSSPIGLAIADIDTPALCLDLDALERNIARASALCREHGVAWRPHAKGHKSPIIARMQIQAGALGVTCAKLGEAEIMAASGVRDILIANLIVGAEKLARLTRLCEVADPMLCVDHPAHIAALSAAASAAGVAPRVLIEVDIGLARVGASPGEATLALARQIADAPSLRLAGIMGYEGHLLTVADPADKDAQIRAALASLVATRDLLESSGIPCPIVSCGGTGSFAISIACPGITEVQAGGLIFMDPFYRNTCQVDDFEYALTLQATVVSRPTPERAIIDAGRKAIHGELHVPIVLGRDDLQVERLSAEHGQLKVAPGADLRIGERLTLVPGYGDLTCALHDEYLVTRDGRVVDVWPVAARGKLR